MAIDTKELARRVGRAIAARRLERGLTQEQVAEQLGVEQETVSRFERGAVLPPLARLAELAELLDVSMESLVRAGSPRPTDQAVELADQLSGLNPRDRELVQRWVLEICDRLRSDRR